MTDAVVTITEDVVHTVAVAHESENLVEVLQDTVVAVVVEDSVHVLTLAEQGPAGPPGAGGAAEFVQPHFVYANGLLRRVEYADGRWRELEFLNGQLRWVDEFDGSQVLRRTFVWDAQGRLVDVVQSEVGV
jgi:hypothetical protein